MVPGQLANRTGDAFIALAAQPLGQFTDVPAPTSALPFRADFGEVVRPDEGRAATVGAVHNDDFLVGQLHIRIGLCNRRITPVGNAAQENARQNFRGELQFRLTPGMLYAGTSAPRTVGRFRTLVLNLA